MKKLYSKKKSAQYYSKVARTEKEIYDFIEAGFEYDTELYGARFFKAQIASSAEQTKFHKNAPKLLFCVPVKNSFG